MINKNGHILIIEDDEKNMKLLRDVLAVMGYEVSEACNGQEGITKILEKAPALILLDWHMPEMGGKEVIDELKKNSITAEIPVVVVTALAMPDSIINIRDSGCDDFVTKPINVPVFLEIVQKYLKP